MVVDSGHTFGEVVRQFRIDRDIKEREFCTNVGRSPSWLYSFERGKKGYYERTAGAIMKAYPELRSRVEQAGLV